ncbi:MAG: sigma-54-dependent Fis family transcriptional regulator [Deltaproteobacteria bacterium]|nr:sigma-54-dependent Fis family transcriptional regulator [Deltaproteobacteria bacterium]
MIVDDDTGLLSSINATLVSNGLPQPALFSDSRLVMAALREQPFSVVLLDLIMPNLGGIDLLRQVKQEFPATECMIVTANDDAASAVQAMKYGAYDYLVKPLDPEKLVIAIRNALERYGMKRELDFFRSSRSFESLQQPEAFADMVAADEAMAQVFNQVEAAAPTDYNVVITGESGTGKELLARIIHQVSLRAQGPFVAVNMAAFSKNLFEDEFFGHDKGAYTGAHAEKKGFFEEAHGGTLFLDEIAEMDPALQAKLLRVLQESQFYRLGSTRSRSVDVRILAATNRDIREEIKRATFREDLYYRLNMFHIHIPALRERPGDILPLANYFLRLHAGRNNKEIRAIDSELEAALMCYGFPGNIRELESVIARAVLQEKGTTLTRASAADIEVGPLSPDVPQAAGGLAMLADIERRHIGRVLDFTAGNKTRAAKILGIGLRTLQRKVKEYENDMKHDAGSALK